jgi:hypothetical protein
MASGKIPSRGPGLALTPEAVRTRIPEGIGQSNTRIPQRNAERRGNKIFFSTPNIFRKSPEQITIL